MLDSHFGVALAQAARTLRAHPLRTTLGTLAILVAVATIALVTTALAGVRQFAEVSAARAFGSDTFVVAQIASPGTLSRVELQRKLERNPPIGRNDARFLDRYAGGRVLYAPTAQRSAEVTAGSRTYDYALIAGTTAEMTSIRDLAIGRGRFFRPDEEVRAAQVAVIGADVAETLFPAQDPLGARIRVAGRGFEVIGVQDRLGTSGGASLDRSVWMPLTTYERILGAPPTLQVFARADDGTSTPSAEDHAVATLRARRQLRPGEDNNFDVLSPEAARDFVFRLTQRVGAAALPISIMALLAAIVVVTNTTLVSVSQRTREIGVRRALGASRRQVAGEVVVESLLIALGGGLLGLAVAWVAIQVGARISELPLSLRPATALWALVASTASGLVAGWYPARRATAIDVIAALRAE